MRTWSSVRQSMVEVAARESDDDAAAGASGAGARRRPRRRRRCRTPSSRRRRAPRRASRARSATGDADELGVHPSREERMVLEARAELGEGSAVTSSTKTTQCGLPIETQVTDTSSPRPRADARRPRRRRRPEWAAVPIGRAHVDGDACHAAVHRLAARSSSRRRRSRRAAGRRARGRGRGRTWRSRGCRCRTSRRGLPSTLQMRIRQSAIADGASRIRPSAPMPRWRSQSRGASAAGSPGNPSRAST